VVFVVTFFLSFIPVIGAAPVAVFLGILALIKQDYEIFGGFMVVALVAGTIDNVIRPILVGNKERVHPIIVLLSLLGAIAIFGIPGLFLGPVIATVTTELYFTYVFERQSPSPETPAPTVPMSK
jgi:predicted PurR-regulated permease PerM